MGVFRVSKVDLREASVVVNSKEVSANSFHAFVLEVFLLGNGEVAEGVNHRQTSDELNLPLVLGKPSEQVLLASQESGTQEDLGSGELPAPCVLVARDQICPVFCCIVDGMAIITPGVDLCEIFRSSAVALDNSLSSLGVNRALFVRWEVIDVGLAGI